MHIVGPLNFRVHSRLPTLQRYLIKDRILLNMLSNDANVILEKIATQRSYLHDHGSLNPTFDWGHMLHAGV